MRDLSFEALAKKDGVPDLCVASLRRGGAFQAPSPSVVGSEVGNLRHVGDLGFGRAGVMGGSDC